MLLRKIYNYLSKNKIKIKCLLNHKSEVSSKHYPNDHTNLSYFYYCFFFNPIVYLNVLFFNLYSKVTIFRIKYFSYFYSFIFFTLDFSKINSKGQDYIYDLAMAKKNTYTSLVNSST